MYAPYTQKYEHEKERERDGTNLLVTSHLCSCIPLTDFLPYSLLATNVETTAAAAAAATGAADVATTRTNE